ncbi:PREDICTED: probable protein phosphatase 2C 26 isoform X1 [Lupinus angustifolius]|uniref:probable protein phosphatase 2C 26 isoform X1 n=1 Tax=Lupinus angustifolius TaxID=3871 RepID=UPI00092E77AF|nr:PREDICTED: probable protein phosphatase 2C 26 isoform X1 [Lupinus angustifolius]
MAIPMLRIATISRCHSQQPLIYSIYSSSFTFDETSKKKKMAVSCSSPSSELNPVIKSDVSFSVGTYLIPHPKKHNDTILIFVYLPLSQVLVFLKVDKGGEDAFFVSNYNGGVVAVADGVSGWAEEDVDPSLFPRELMTNASNFVGDEEVNYDPQILIRKAHAATSSTGSATVIVAMLEKNGILKIANVGDCGLRVIRNGNVILSTSPQEHYFDCPFQLSSERVGQTYLDAAVSNVELIEGDTIVVGSDGLFDNVFDHEIVSTIVGHRNVAEAAKALANLASNHALDSNFDSPYSLEARSRGFEPPLWKKILGMKLTGGKLDDITVIVGEVVSS